ncbi:hypothetical protein BDW59DRAFT_178723 [Aspergillus cavernicola]|uniref:Helicase C-terminal domain-containing protein n=1 Tax=Aspergillus cavernicola TaxID=176166 RepID=A0ABR4J2D3_9EURO
MPAKRKRPLSLPILTLASTRTRRSIHQPKSHDASIIDPSSDKDETQYEPKDPVIDNEDIPSAPKRARRTSASVIPTLTLTVASTRSKRSIYHKPQDGCIIPSPPENEDETNTGPKDFETGIGNEDLPSASKRPKETSPEAQSQPTPNIAEATTPASNDNVAQDLNVDNEIPEIVRSQPYSGPRRPRTQLALSLPPLYKLTDIYKSLTNRAVELNLDAVLSHLGSRQLRVVTVCSGTESPLLALEMVRENLQKYFNRDLNFKHLFSAEIVPFKQAYIERNFHPRFIFRDVAELKNRVAQTAYGSLSKIPKNTDILIAGFSCVDFSAMNNHRKTLDEKGESGGTFWGIIRHAMTYRPRLVILENVKTAPWKKIAQHWNEIDYIAVHADVDTKAYYLPQTRERGYMFCVDKRVVDSVGLEGEEVTKAWTEALSQFKRPASSPAGMFLLNAEDRRLEMIEKDMAARIISSAAGGSSRTVNWDRYQVRHQSYRLNQGLGHRRPISKSQDDGTCRMPDFAWRAWVRALPERVWDTIDVNFLRKLVDGYDMNYKERCLELSQGIDREIDCRAYGIVGCITPCGIPYITTRGGPLCGLESLALQGLPLDRLLLTQESQRELQDLAGNAMSSTIVGAAILSALIVGYKVLDAGNDDNNTLPAPIPRLPKRKELITPRTEDNLVPSSMYLDTGIVLNTPMLRVLATRSARYCLCERQSSIRASILRCALCSHTACSECAGNPSHAYERWTDLVRSEPSDFVSELHRILPARLVISGISRESYKELQCDLSTSTSQCSPEIWTEFLNTVSEAIGDELRFLDAKRSESWTILYDGKYSFLKLVIEDGSMTWLFFAKPRETDPAVCLMREILSKPIARMVVPQLKCIFEGTWEICAPLSSRCSLEIFGSGSQVQSYEAKCGLELDGYKNSTVWTHITVQSTDEEVKDLGIDIRGTYELLQDCGTANACLHRRTATIDGTSTVYLFFDPTKLGEPKNDPFVFSLEHRRNPGYDARLTVAEVSHRWRSSRATEKAERTAVFYRKWTAIQTASLRAYIGDAGSPIRCRSLDPRVSVSISNSGCHDANMTLLYVTMAAAVINSPSGTTEWEVENPIDSPHLVREYAWLLQKAARHSNFGSWNAAVQTRANSRCTVCVPLKPQILWGHDRRGWIKAYDDPYDAALYERQVKARPSPFLIFRRTDEQGLGELRVTLNLQTLLHQAYQRLVGPDTVDSAILHWRLVPNSYDVKNSVFPEFFLRSNRDDDQYSQPPGFLLNLRPEQLRSLSWMIKQEDEDTEPFVEEETEEVLLTSLMWRAEGRVSVFKTVRGGILADNVGYGKTAIVLGLIDTQSGKSKVDLTCSLNKDKYIPSRATLIVVPWIMLRQWQSEITKFLGDRYSVLAFPSVAALAKTSVRGIRNCDIILVSSAVFNTQAYYQRMEEFTGTASVPEKAGRHFDDWFQDAHESMRERVRVLVEQGQSAFVDSLRAKLGKAKDDENYTYVPSKRLRGKQYELANRDKASNANGVSYAEISDDEASELSDEEDLEILRARVDQLLELVPPNPFGIKEEKSDEQEDAEHEDSFTETKSTKAKGQGKRAKNTRESGAFNIPRNKKIQDWETMTTPLFHAFEFNRLVIDEFTYANTGRLAPLLALQARSKWVLSGTPPLNDFADVNTIAPFLGVHLGIDDDGDIHSQDKRFRVLHSQRSDAETFQSFQAPRSEAWHWRRHELAQTFLDRFARRNVAEIDEIPSTEHIVLVQQSPAEKAIYLELYKQLMTYNRQLRRSGGRGRFSSDQADRIDEIIGSSSTAEEALLKRCTSLALQGRWNDDGRPEAATCESLIANREEQLAQLKDDLNDKLKLAAWVYCACDAHHEIFDKFVESVIRHDFGDMTVTVEVYPLLKTAVLTSKDDDWKTFFAPNSNTPGENEDDDEDEADGEAEKSSKRTTKTKDTTPLLPTKPARLHEFEPILRDVTTTIRNLIVEWVLRERALRFLKTIRQIQTMASDDDKIPPCHNCQSQPPLLATTNILGSCGHVLCSNCIPQAREKEECPVEGCRGSGKRFNIINALTLGADTPTDSSDKSSLYGGTKLDALVDILRNKIPFNERALLFIQFPDLTEIASKALQLAGIKHTIISSADRKSTQKIENFQKTSFGENKVMLLNLGSEMAAGLNLQCANHILFLSPLHTQTQYDYDSSMIQAIGRCRRYGQTRHVHVYHLLAKMTIDVNIFQDRRGKVLVERNGDGDGEEKAVLVSPEEALESEVMTCQGPELVVDNAF